ncbi:SlyX family protein [Paracoccus fistulariae]|uniref:SlyX family protein n=1 Tax=Paracoccus fistulariae TaxID=658446 RepID=A0ABY7SMG2_9RHOB|nr:SlyX family protein [Paracoccus fistulariae]MDB6180601.1 SlyX family protein [Paracoccus fistulariae]WCR07161.1 SlyX family protein [Paracoccus fistulariae]
MNKNPGENDDAQIRQLQETVAHLTRLTEELNEVIARQDGEIARLTRRVDMLWRHAAEQQADAESGAIPLADQRPPHW